ncbi:MAG TPA: enoyl-CoA hydratase/isomerase family protein [Pararhizobium sp.]|nr:enoyl-CoA hydratase/isomerase family protein [Pararhizobium sp.]
MSVDGILIRAEGRVGHITLDRPKALNALTYDMATAIEMALRKWVTESSISMVLIDAIGERAFCAGGDIQDLYRTGRAGDFGFGRRFWADEYRLNALIANYPKPYVALMDGIVMGGGVGISAHGSHRVVTERTQLAMPECAIGLIPDVGGSWRLAHAPGHIGDYVGLAGARLGPADAIYAGLADGFVPVSVLGKLKAALIESGDPDVLAEFWDEPEEGKLPRLRCAIDTAFGQADLVGTLVELEAQESEWAVTTVRALRKACPISLSCAFEIIRSARQATRVEDALAMEYRFVSRCMEHGDFLEGVRAAIIDKDRAPRWRHGRIEDVTAEEVTSMLAPAEGGDLNFQDIKMTGGKS